MGQRGNYILIEADKQTIHYTHWRANCIPSDLYLGERRFIEFVKDCKVNEILLEEPWIEGCVIINVPAKAVYFWSFGFEVTSVTDFYLDRLQEKWFGWSINLLYNQMYDVEKILNINYIANQKLSGLYRNTLAEIIDDTVDTWINTVAVLKTNAGLHCVQFEGITVEGIVNFGENIVELLLKKERRDLPVEHDDIYGCILIDTLNHEIIVDASAHGLWEQTYQKWPGYRFTMGDFGYIGLLKRIGIDVDGLTMSPDKIKVAFDDMIKQSNDFDPTSFAKSFLQENKEVQFNRDFFDSINPKKTLFEKIRIIGNKILKRI